MSRLALLAALLPTFALAAAVSGTDTNPSTAISSSVIGPDAPVVLNVTPDGYDGADCLDAGVGGCATITRALQLAQRVLLTSSVTIQLWANDAGTVQVYTDSPIISGFNGRTLDGGVASTQGTFLTIQGPTDYITVPWLDGGAATGTLTANTAQSGTTAQLETDSTQTWANQNLKGMYLVITGGAGATPAPNNKIPIFDNTATVARVTGAITSIASAQTYAIQTPSVAIQMNSAPTTANVFKMVNNSVPVSFNDLEIRARSTNASWPSCTDSSGTVAFTRVRMTGSNGLSPSTSAFMSLSGCKSVTFNRVIAESTSNTGSVLLTNTNITMTQTYFRAGFGNITYSQGSNSVGSTGMVLESVNSGGNGVIAFPFATSSGLNTLLHSTAPLRIICPSANTAIYAAGNTSRVGNFSVVRMRVNSLVTESCANGVLMAGPYVSYDNTSGSAGASLMNSVTTGFDIAAGARLHTESAHTWTFTPAAVSGELRIDGTYRPIAYIGNQSMASMGTGTTADGTNTINTQAEVPMVYGQAVGLATPATLPTCGYDGGVATVPVGSMAIQGGTGSSSSVTRWCMCSHVAANNDQWCSITSSPTTFAGTCTGGSTTVCP